MILQTTKLNMIKFCSLRTRVAMTLQTAKLNTVKFCSPLYKLQNILYALCCNRKANLIINVFFNDINY